MAAAGRSPEPEPAPALVQARTQFADLAARALTRGLVLRRPPPEPTTCCGRGCNGCVWEGFYAAAAAWVDDAQAALQAAAASPLASRHPQGARLGAGD